MQNCQKCGHEFSYFNMLIAFRKVTCPECGTTYKIEAKNIYALMAVIAVALVLLSYLEDVLAEDLIWMAYIAILGGVVLIVPFNQRLEPENESDE